MRKLNTIQIHENLNSVYAVDGNGPGGASHNYIITKCTDDVMEPPIAEVKFQCGPRKDENSVHGVIDGDLLEIVRDRLIAFQAGPYSSEYNQEALEHVEAALVALNKRVEDRIKRDVLGTYEK